MSGKGVALTVFVLGVMVVVIGMLIYNLIPTQANATGYAQVTYMKGDEICTFVGQYLVRHEECAEITGLESKMYIPWYNVCSIEVR